MNFIVVHLLHHLNQGNLDTLKKDAEKTFYLFSALMKNHKIEAFFEENLPRINESIELFWDKIAQMDSMTFSYLKQQ